MNMTPSVFLQFSIKNLPRKLLCSQEVSNGQETFYEATTGAAGNEKNSAIVSDIEKVIANKQPDEQSHDIAAHQIMADIARPDIEPDGQIIRVDINLVYAEEQVRPEEDFEEDIIDGMSDTFETIGMLTPPRCYPRDRRGYQIWLGETRVRTARKRGDTHIDIYVGKPPRKEKNASSVSLLKTCSSLV